MLETHQLTNYTDSNRTMVDYRSRKDLKDHYVFRSKGLQGGNLSLFQHQRILTTVRSVMMLPGILLDTLATYLSR